MGEKCLYCNVQNGEGMSSLWSFEMVKCSCVRPFFIEIVLGGNDSSTCYCRIVGSNLNAHVTL